MEEANKSGFPDENVSEDEKKSPEYGCRYAKAMYSAAGSVNSDRFYAKSAYYDLLYKFAQGQQDVEAIKTLLGKYATKDGGEDISHTYISANEIKLIPKYINLLQGKLSKVQFDIRLTPLDPLALEPQKEYQAKLQTVLDFRKSGLTSSVSEFMSEAELFPEIDPQVLAELDEEYLVNLQMNPRYRSAMEGEMAIEKAFNANDWERIEGEILKDIKITGLGIGRTFNDKNGNQKIERIDPRGFITSYLPKGESFEGMQDAGYVAFLTHSEFRREASPYLDEETINDIIKGKIKTSGGGHPVSGGGSTYGDSYYDTRNTPLGKIAVLRFQFLTENKRAYVVRKNAYGNTKMEPKKFGFKPAQNEQPLYESGEKKLLQPTWTAKYSGSWVMGTDFVFGYDVDTNSQRSLNKFVDERLNYFVFAPNMVDGKTVSMIEQVMEPLSMLAVAWNKFKMIMGRGYMGNVKIRFDRLAEVAMSTTDKWTPGQIYKHWVESGILLDAGGESGDNGSALEIVDGGLSAGDYLSTIQTCNQLIQDITGVNALSDGSTPAERTGVGVAQQALAESNNALSYLFRAKQHLHKRFSYSILLLVQKAVRDGFKIPLSSTLGQNSLSFWEGTITSVTEAVALTDMAVEVDLRPGDADWQWLYQMVTDSVIAGRLEEKDAIFIKRIKNLKQAEEVFTLRAKKYKQQMQQQKQLDVDNNIKQSEAAAQAAMQVKLAEINAQRDADIAVKRVEGEEERLTEQVKGNVKGMIQQSMNQAKLDAADKTVKGTILSTALKTNATDKQTEVKAAEKSEPVAA